MKTETRTRIIFYHDQEILDIMILPSKVLTKKFIKDSTPPRTNRIEQIIED